MGRYADAAREIKSAVSELVERLTDIVNEELDTAEEDAYKEYGEYETRRVREIFNEAVTEFYDAYPAGDGELTYSRNGNPESETGGLYNILEITQDEYGMVVTEAAGYTDLFNPDKMHAGREGGGLDGGGLYEKVFIQGWHGGAAGTDHNNKTVSTPHYRVPKGYYTYWGRKATRTTPPASIFAKNYQKADSKELQNEFDRLIEEHEDKANERIARRQKDLEDELFG